MDFRFRFEKKNNIDIRSFSHEKCNFWKNLGTEVYIQAISGYHARLKGCVCHKKYAPVSVFDK